MASWIDKDYQSGMSYMERNLEKRQDASLILEGAKSVISLGMNYYTEGQFLNSSEFGKVSRLPTYIYLSMFTQDVLVGNLVC